MNPGKDLNLHLQIRECVAEKLANEPAEELFVAGAGGSLVGVDRTLNFGGAAIGREDEVEHSHKQHGLCLETGLVIGIRQDEEDVLKNGHKELLEECICGLRIRLLGDVRDKLQAHVKARSLDITIIVLAGPHASVNNELELAVVQLKQRGEAVKVDRSEQVEEFHAVLRELRKVLVDHVQRAFKDVLHNDGYLILHETLNEFVSKAGLRVMDTSGANELCLQ